MRESGALRWSGPKQAKRKGRGPTLEEMRTDHAIRSSVAITKLPLGRDIRKEMNLKKEKYEILANRPKGKSPPGLSVKPLRGLYCYLLWLTSKRTGNWR